MTEHAFVTEGPCPEELFFGRSAETERVLSLLRRDQNVSIVGPRRIGKSSLLHHISEPAVFEAYGLTRDRHRFVYTDCRALAESGPWELHIKIVDSAMQEIPEVEYEPPSTSESITSFDYCRRFFRKVKKAGVRCIVMLDHFTSLIENPQADRDCLGGMRALNAMYQVLYVVASAEPMSKLEKRWMDRQHGPSPFFNIFYSQILVPFSRDEGRAFLSQRFRAASLSVPNSVMDLIVSWAAGHPFHLQRAGTSAASLLDDVQTVWSGNMTERLQDYLAGLSKHDIPAI